MIKNILFCMVLFLLGLWIGTLNGTVVEVEVVKEVKVSVPYLDMTAPDLKHKLEICANTLGLTLESKKKLEQYRADINRIYDKRKDETKKLEHYWWTVGYKEGYKNARTE